MKIIESQEYQALKLAEMLETDGWKVFQNIIETYIVEYIGSSVPRDQLIGLKLALSLPEDYLTRLRNSL